MLLRKFPFCFLITLILLNNVPSQTAEEDFTDTLGVSTLILDNLQLTLSSKLLVDIYSPRGSVLKGYLGWLPQRSNTSYRSCSGNDSQAGSICLKYDKDMELLITQDNSDQCDELTTTCHSISCYKVQWKNHLSGAMDCFVIGDDFWYGGGETMAQRWPLEGDSRSWHATVTGDPLHHPAGSVIENLWLSSGGFSIYVEHHVPLFVSFNESGSGKFCLSTSSKKYPYQNKFKNHNQELTYSICAAMDVKEVYSYSAHRWLPKPLGEPEETMFQFPIWSTWARYKRDINEEVVYQFAHNILAAEFTASQLEIDDKWEKCYGDLDFDTEKFPDPKKMTEKLKSLGFHITLWIHPFCNPECKTYNIGKEKGFWVKNRDGTLAEVNWWNGIDSAVLDTTNKEAVEWFLGRLKRLKETYGIESFKFDAGEIQWLQTEFILEGDANFEPNIYSREYARLASVFGNRVEVRVGYESQELPIFVRMFDKFSHWDYSNGLQTIIPTALQFSMLGYIYILPDMVGGNNYESFNDSFPHRELYIRWLEANVFLPAIQFSIAPFDYDEEILRIAKKMMQLREKYMQYILTSAHRATETGEPIIRPLWWIAPDDYEALSTDSQFLLGDAIMVAPVLEEGARNRNIYLPEGKWTDIQKRRTYEGSQWLYNYEAPLNFLPFFVRQS